MVAPILGGKPPFIHVTCHDIFDLLGSPNKKEQWKLMSHITSFLGDHRFFLISQNDLHGRRTRTPGCLRCCILAELCFCGFHFLVREGIMEARNERLHP